MNFALRASRTALFCLASSVVPGCGDSAGDGGSGGGASDLGGGGSSSSTLSSGGEAAGGGLPSTIVVGGDRPVTVEVPAAYDPAVPAPLLILLHGYSANGGVQELYFQLGPEADARGVVYAHPDGTVDAQGNQFWNAFPPCCDFGHTGVDDASYLMGLVDEISAQLTIDPKRVYFVGHSNGAFMSYRMACDHADRVAAVVGLAGAMSPDPTFCAPSSPVSVLAIHGVADATVLYEGGVFGTEAYTSADQTVAFWAEHDGCAIPGESGAAFDFDPGLPGEETTPLTFAGCEQSSEATLWSIEGGQHIPGLPDDYAARVIDFLLAHPKP